MTLGSIKSLEIVPKSSTPSVTRLGICKILAKCPGKHIIRHAMPVPRHVPTSKKFATIAPSEIRKMSAFAAMASTCCRCDRNLFQADCVYVIFTNSPDWEVLPSNTMMLCEGCGSARRCELSLLTSAAWSQPPLWATVYLCRLLPTEIVSPQKDPQRHRQRGGERMKSQASRRINRQVIRFNFSQGFRWRCQLRSGGRRVSSASYGSGSRQTAFSGS